MSGEIITGLDKSIDKVVAKYELPGRVKVTTGGLRPLPDGVEVGTGVVGEESVSLDELVGKVLRPGLVSVIYGGDRYGRMEVLRDAARYVTGKQEKVVYVDNEGVFGDWLKVNCREDTDFLNNLMIASPGNFKEQEKRVDELRDMGFGKLFVIDGLDYHYFWGDKSEVVRVDEVESQLVTAEALAVRWNVPVLVSLRDGSMGDD